MGIAQGLIAALGVLVFVSCAAGTSDDAALGFGFDSRPWSVYDPGKFVHIGVCAEMNAVLDVSMTTRQMQLSLVALKESILKMRPGELAIRRRQLACIFWQLHSAHVNEGVKMSDTLAERLLDVVFAYWRVYENISRQKLWIYHFHISKAGGTTMCRLAAFNGCIAPGFAESLPGHGADGQNCFASALVDNTRWNPSNPAAMDEHEKIRTCDRRKAFIERTGVHYEANENWIGVLDSDPTCSRQALSFVVLRDPVERAVSMLSHARRMIPASSLRANECPVDPRKPSLPGQRFDPECTLERWYYPTDNYQVRMLGGFPAASRPFGGVLQEDVEQAKLAVRMMDALFIQHGGEPKYSASDATHFALGLGYTVKRDVHISRDTRRHKHEEFGFTEDHYDILKRRNALDSSLFGYATKLWNLDHFVMHHTERACEEAMSQASMRAINTSRACAMLRKELDPLHNNEAVNRNRGVWRPASCGCGYIGMTNYERPECLSDFLRDLPAYPRNE